MADTSTNYDQSDLDIEPLDLKNAATDIGTRAQEIADAVTRIATKLNELTTNGWRGASKQDAEDFNNRWTAMMKELFGTKEDPKGGVLNAIALGIGTAYSNYNKVELGLTKAWRDFSNNLPSAGEDGGDGEGKKPSTETPPDVTDKNKTAITADY